MIDLGQIAIYGGTALVVGLACVFLWLYLKKNITEGWVEKARLEAKTVTQENAIKIEQQRREAELQTKERLFKEKSEWKSERDRRLKELQDKEKNFNKQRSDLEKFRSSLGKQQYQLNSFQKELDERQKNLAQRESELDVLIREQQRQLERISGLTREEAANKLVRSMENEARQIASKQLRKIEEDTKKTLKQESQKILAQAMQRSASDYVVETTVTVVPLPNEEMKGRIIGREGRNIRALEMATGVDLIVDDTPEAVLLSSFDPVRREITKQALERLVADGRIHPARIEEVVEKVKEELELSMQSEGEQVCFELGLHDVHPELQKMVGRLKYRTSYGQNILYHSREVAILSGIMAEELGVNARRARRCGLLHDVGKAVDKEVEGTHVKIGQDCCRRYGEDEYVINSVAYHHFEVEANCIESVLVQIADTLSAARPGARREILESYIKRLEKLESLADGFQGVERAYALQAGREIRIMVESDRVSDDDSMWLARDISKKIEENLEYPGEIKVTVIRETRHVEFAR